ncbi:ATP-binding protein [Pseudolysobacter antarcticus]|uniref:ATP-binding protein n=1 Tax=Pseudolysobacter antarcticus TaxID=2511995 RepID=A0A411HFX8_9GAMM|nr:ATP-binding protein [Pseudolysobacter antarcticus]QBB69360.1 ATP-binding protein [Pseudolysobacter antarcticus]
MSDGDAIKALVKVLQSMRPGGALKHYITHATFPKFKSLEPGTRVDFEFPLTALVGANGIGKSSLLHALWGMPKGYSTSRFWFSTDLDPIEENQKSPQRYFYGHWNESFNGIVETRKARLGKSHGRDYWEPYRLSKRDGMLPLPDGEFEGKAQDRWNPVTRLPVYINLKTTFGSFDRYFYFDNGQSAGDKRDVMLREARRLKTIVSTNKQSFKLGGIERVYENRMLSDHELLHVSRILGRDYDSARIVRHSLYPGNRGQDLSVIFRRTTEYSEAFAGSGEIAAVSAVIQVLEAPEYSLILLDEPETSLHPGAQRALLRFLLEQIKLKKHQIILSTHSSEFLFGLPHEAIKVFEDNGNMQSRILPRSSASAALKRLGKPPENKLRILVEDSLAQMLVRHAANGLDQGDSETLEVVVFPGGAESILKYHGPTEMVLGHEVFVLLDGDKRRKEKFSDPDQIPKANFALLGDILKTEIGCDPMLPIPGGNDNVGHTDAKIKAQLDYLRWLREHVDFLPKKLPEQIVLEAMHPNTSYENATAKKTKADFKSAMADGTDVTLSSLELLAIAKVKIAKIANENSDITKIRNQLKDWLHV